MRKRLRLLTFCGSALLGGCFQADVPASYIPPYDAGPIDPAFLPEPLDAGVAKLDAGSLRFEVMTAPVGGRFAPRNVGAIWIETEQGQFIKTLEVWAQTRARYLRRFQAASGGDTTDAITSATLKKHEPHAVTWNLTDKDRQLVMDGNYRVALELTDKNGTGASHEVPFMLGTGPLLLTPADTAQFKQMQLRLEQ